MCMCVCVRVCACVREGKVFHNAPCLVCCTTCQNPGSTCIVSSISYVCLLQQYVAILQIAPDCAFIKHAYQADVSMDFHLID